GGRPRLRPRRPSLDLDAGYGLDALPSSIRSRPGSLELSFRPLARHPSGGGAGRRSPRVTALDGRSRPGGPAQDHLPISPHPASRHPRFLPGGSTDEVLRTTPRSGGDERTSGPPRPLVGTVAGEPPAALGLGLGRS